MKSPTGRQVDLTFGPYRATVTEVGATLRTLTFGSRPLIAGFGEDEAMPAFSGAVLAPWPNRVIGARYTFDGQTHQLPVSEPGRNAALHGFVAWQTWTVSAATRSMVDLTTVVYPQPGYPFLLTLQARYQLDRNGLRIVVSARNDGPTDAPYGVSIHPWLTAATGNVSEWTLTIPADEILTIDDQWSPTGVQEVQGEFDYRRSRALGDTRLDHTFTAVRFDDTLGARSTLRSPDGSGVSISWGSECQWVQICTGDEATPERNRRAVAIEPMTCPPDAFQSGAGLIRLSPRQTHTASWQISPLYRPGTLPPLADNQAVPCRRRERPTADRHVPASRHVRSP